MNATYSPEDNKLRLYSLTRLDRSTYERVKAAGFKWAPRQELFVAPMWTPAREDLLMELCGEIGDEDTGLVERAEERAERFEDYSDRRAHDATAAHGAVSAIADGIPFGQPILVGHHSERRARKDAEKIENGMRRAVKMWETSEYWKQRAAGALRHAKYKELPAVRHRRIKGLEADKRKQERAIEEAAKFLRLWQSAGLTFEQAQNIANYDHVSKCFPLAEYPRNPPASQYEGMMSIYSALVGGVINLEQARDISIRANERTIENAKRWLAHYEHRIAYERAMLDEQGGLKAEGFDIQPGGRVLIDGEWLVVMRINKKGGEMVSVTTSARFVPVRGIEEIKDYKAPSTEEAAALQSMTKLAPLANYPGEGFLHITKQEWEKTGKDYKGTRELGTGAVRPRGYRPDIKNADLLAEQFGRHRVRTIVRGGLCPVFITDLKRTDPPAATQALQPEIDLRPEPDLSSTPAVYTPPARTMFDDMRDCLKAGFQVVSAPQLFPTPPELAARMVEIAAIERGHSVLEPSAGTGNILRAIREATSGGAVRTAVEIDARLCDRLRIAEEGAEVVNCDFLTFDAPAKYDRILMNPPFANADDIKHIRHALGMLKPGGRLVAICANGPRQKAALMPLVDDSGGLWEDLPSGTFAESGTMVNAALLAIEG